MTNAPRRHVDEDAPGRMRRILQFVRSNLLAGLLVAGPLFATMMILGWMYFKIDPPVQKDVLLVMGIDPTRDKDLNHKPALLISDSTNGDHEVGEHEIRFLPLKLSWLPHWLNPNWVSTSATPDGPQYQVIFGLGLFVLLVILFLLGFLTRTFLGRWIIDTLDWLINRIPLVNTLYSSLKQLTDTFFGQKPGQKAEKEVVLVEFPHPGAAVIGFVTGVTKAHIQTGAIQFFNQRIAGLPPVAPSPLAAGTVTGDVQLPAGAPVPPAAMPAGAASPESAAPTAEEMCLVFVPMSPLPTGGFLVVVPRSRVTKLDITMEQAFQLIVSGGIIQPNGMDPAKSGRGQAVSPDVAPHA
ncbi:MAG: DUF502 domain-containing protein [Planctomycetota bacterium]